MAENMIITIGRQFGSGGHQVGRKLAKELGLKIYDKELLKLVAEESGICEKVLENYDEKPTSSLLYSIVMDVYPSMNYVGTTLNQQIYQAQYDAIRRLDERESCVIVGRGADYILRDFPELFSVFITAPVPERLARVMDRNHIPEEDAAAALKKVDRQRAVYYNFYTGKQWGAPESYHLTVDSSILGIEGTARLLEDKIKVLS